MYLFLNEWEAKECFGDDIPPWVRVYGKPPPEGIESAKRFEEELERILGKVER